MPTNFGSRVLEPEGELDEREPQLEPEPDWEDPQSYSAPI